MQTYKQILFIVGSNLEPASKDFSSKQITVMRAANSAQILARLKFSDQIVFFQIQGEVLIISSGGGLYIFCLKTLQKLQTFQCNSVFQTFLKLKDGA